jgi:hypothetical protein
VRHQVDILTKGLLEIRTIHSGIVCQNASQYFRNCVEFLYRSVKDYLKNEWDYDNFQLRQSKEDEFETYCRLRLAEAKFSRIMANYDKKRGFYSSIYWLYGINFEWIESCSQPLSPTYFEEWGRVMESFRHLLRSQMKTSQLASCWKLWSRHEAINNFQHSSTIGLIQSNTSYLHWASSYQFTNVVELLKQQNDLRNSDTDELNILLTASASAKPDLVEFLLRKGSSST